MSESLVDQRRLGARVGRAVAAVFVQYAEPVTSSELDSLRELVSRHCAGLRGAGPSGDVELADRIGAACLGLIDAVDRSERQHVALVVGAVSYFAINHDAVPDLGSPDGFVDDAKIVNFVIEETGLAVDLVPC